MHSESSGKRDGTPLVEKVYWLPRIALAAFVIGAIAILAGLAAVSGVNDLVEVGAGFWLLAYFLILFDNFDRKIPVWSTAAGLLRHEDGAVRYAFFYVIPLVMGLFALFMLLALVILY